MSPSSGESLRCAPTLPMQSKSPRTAPMAAHGISSLPVFGEAWPTDRRRTAVGWPDQTRLADQTADECRLGRYLFLGRPVLGELRADAPAVAVPPRHLSLAFPGCHLDWLARVSRFVAALKSLPSRVHTRAKARLSIFASPPRRPTSSDARSTTARPAMPASPAARLNKTPCPDGGSAGRSKIAPVTRLRLPVPTSQMVHYLLVRASG